MLFLNVCQPVKDFPSNNGFHSPDFCATGAQQSSGAVAQLSRKKIEASRNVDCKNIFRFINVN